MAIKMTLTVARRMCILDREQHELSGCQARSKIAGLTVIERLGTDCHHIDRRILAEYSQSVVRGSRVNRDDLARAR